MLVAERPGDLRSDAEQQIALGTDAGNVDVERPGETFLQTPLMAFRVIRCSWIVVIRLVRLS